MRQKHNKTAIIEEGIQLFREKGYHNTGVDDILKTCKIPSGSFYNFFKNKEGFAVQALDHYNQRYLEYLKQYLEDDSVSPIQRLKNVFQGNVNMHLEKECSVGCLLNSLTSEVGVTSPLIGEKIVADFSKNNEALAKTIQAGQDLGEIRKDFTATELADYLINGFAGATIRMKAGKTETPLNLFMKTAFEFIKA